MLQRQSTPGIDRTALSRFPWCQHSSIQAEVLEFGVEEVEGILVDFELAHFLFDHVEGILGWSHRTEQGETDVVDSI